MKRVTAIVLILVMSAQSLYQLGLITYFQVNRDFIAEVLCINRADEISTCHGQCYLKRNLNLADEQDATPAPKPGKDKSEVSVFLVEHTEFSLGSDFFDSQKNFAATPQSVKNYTSSIFHPPCQSA